MGRNPEHEDKRIFAHAGALARRPASRALRHYGASRVRAVGLRHLIHLRRHRRGRRAGNQSKFAPRVFAEMICTDVKYHPVSHSDVARVINRWSSRLRSCRWCASARSSCSTSRRPSARTRPSAPSEKLRYSRERVPSPEIKLAAAGDIRVRAVLYVLCS